MTLKVTERDLLKSILSEIKDEEYVIVDIEKGEFDDGEGNKREYARLVVCEKEEWKLLNSVKLTERAELSRFPIAKYDGTDLGELVGKTISPIREEGWFLRKEKINTGFRKEEQICGVAYRVTMAELREL